jgi:bacterioferritin-associated ferredoxin
MIICSCNTFSDHRVRITVAKAALRPRISQIYGFLGHSARCGRCAHTINQILEETGNGHRINDALMTSKSG